jgi:hypothetical protein
MKDMKERNLFSYFMADDIDKQLNFLIGEFLHISFIIRFFRKEDFFEENIKGQKCNFREETFNKLPIILYEVKDTLLNIIETWKQNSKFFKEKKFSLDLKISDKNYEEYKNSFIYLIEIKKELNKLLEIFDFLQKKLLSFQSGSQNYYPTPKISSLRESPKIHLFMEQIAKGFGQALTKNKKFETIFFWDYSPQVKFLNVRNSLIINTDFFVPHRQTHWIILLHEVFHYLLKNFKEGNDFYFEKETLEFFEEISNELEESIHACRLALLKEKYFIPPDFNTITDIFIDSLLSLSLGINYFLPITIKLFAYDEKSFIFPFKRRWYIRLKTLIKIFKEKNLNGENIQKFTKQYVEDLNNFLTVYNKLQILSSRGLLKEDFFIIENIIIETLYSYLIEILTKYSKEVKKVIEKNTNKWLKNYISFTEFFIKDILAKNSNSESMEINKEGRILCYLFQENICCAASNKNIEKNLEYAKNLNVYKFNLFKLRFDTTNILNFLFENRPLMWSLGLSFYNILSISSKPFFEKIDYFNNIDTTQKIINTLFENNRNNSNSNAHHLDELTLIRKKIFFYKEELNLTLFNKNKTQEFEEIVKEQSKYIFILVKLSCNINNDKSKTCYKYLENIFEEKLKTNSKNKDKISVFVFSSYDWPDYTVLIAIKPLQDLNLDDILRFLKRDILLKNPSYFRVNRSETLLFIGSKLFTEEEFSNINLPYINLLVRIASGDLGKSLNFIEKLQKSNFKVFSSFGRMDLIISLKESLTIAKFKEHLKKILDTAKDVKISDIQIEPIIDWNKDNQWS